MPTTKTPPPTNPAADLADRLLNEAKEIALAAQEVLWNNAGTYPFEFSNAELAVLRSAGFTEDVKINDEMRRINTAKRHMENAGSDAEFASAEKHLVTTRAEEKRLGPQLEEQIRQAEQKLKQIREASQRAEMTVNRMRSARESLLADGVIPTFCLDEVNANYRLQLPALKQRVNKLEGRLRLIDSSLNLVPGSREAMAYAERVEQEREGNDFFARLINREVTGQVIRKTLHPQNFASHLQELKVERPQVEMELQSAREALAQRREECDDARKYYLRKLQ